MAASRSLKATQAGVNQIETALTTKQWGHEKLAEKADVTRSTAINFCTGKPVYRRNFARFCELLELNWEIISGNAVEAKPKASPSISIDIDTLVQNLRDEGRADIQSRCGTMRVLDMTQPIDTNSIYTDVNILEKVAGKTRAEISQLMEGCSPENFDRFFLGNRQKRVDGLEAVSRHNLLMILGRPGAGKTTFMKRLAMLCNLGERFADRVPVFVTLKEFADIINQPGLVNTIAASFAPQFGLEACRRLLESGRGLILLDGLDEVQEKDHDRVLREIRDFSRRYSQNVIIITCRIAAREYIFEQFTEIEIADFNEKQVEDFVTKWFFRKNPQQTKLFLERLETSEPVKELATNPLLLTLLCLEFEESSDFPASRAELYQRGLNVLLTKWDGQRGIKRDVVYKKLSTKRKESLLGELAFYTFNRGDYFFKQSVAEQQISKYIENLPDARTDPVALLVDSHAVLESIESQHGLLTERATEIYSFSHLTFHEYFTSKYFAENYEKNIISSQLLKHTTEKRWREVFLLVTEQLEPANIFLQELKINIDDSIREDRQLQGYLSWVQVKSKSIRSLYKNSAVRAYYFFLMSNRGINHTRLAQNNELIDILDLDPMSGKILDGDCDLILVLALAKATNKAYQLAMPTTRPLHIADALKKAISYLEEDMLIQQLQNLVDRLPSSFQIENQLIKQCWDDQSWILHLRQVMITHRNIGHDWQFTKEQQLKLHQYYEANQLLVDCLNSECYVTRPVREEIEETLFLPIAEIEKWKREHRPQG